MKKIFFAVLITSLLFAEQWSVSKESEQNASMQVINSNTPETNAIKKVFKDEISNISFVSWAKGMEVDFTTKKMLHTKTYKKYAKTMANIVRKTRDVKGKVDICYFGTEDKKIQKCAKF